MNRAALADRWKILYPSLVEHFLFPYPLHQEFFFQRSGGGWRSSQEVCDFFAKAFEFSATHDIRHIVVSWEAFFEVPWMDLLAESLSRMGVTSDFIVYLRQQDAWLESAWKHWRRTMPGDPSVSEYALNTDSDWYNVLSLWTERFPKQNFRVRPYEKRQLQGGLLPDFFESLGYDKSLAYELARSSESEPTAGSRLAPDVVSMQASLRELNSRPHEIPLFDELPGDPSEDREPESHRLLSPDDRIKILQKNELSNQRIAREYLGRSDGRLFLEPWPDPEEPWHLGKTTSTRSDPLRKPRIFAIGHSHLAAMKRLYGDWRDSGESCGAEFTFVQLLQDKYKPELVEGQLGPSVAEALNADSWDAVISVAGGNLYNWLGLTEHPRRLDFISPDAPSAPLAEGAEIVPTSAIRRRMVAESQEHLALLTALRAATTAPMYHLESPPPIPSEAHIRKYPDPFRKELEVRPVTPAFIRWKLWRLQSGIFQEFCDALGIEFVPAPSDMVDENGMLAEIAWPPEPTHANQIYGRRQIRQIEECVLRAMQ
jgi:hypothetical protein